MCLYDEATHFNEMWSFFFTVKQLTIACLQAANTECYYLQKHIEAT